MRLWRTGRLEKRRVIKLEERWLFGCGQVMAQKEWKRSPCPWLNHVIDGHRGTERLGRHGFEFSFGLVACDWGTI